MQSTLKQHPNNVSANHQATNHPPAPHTKAPISMEQQLSSLDKLPSEVNVQKASLSVCNASKSLNQNDASLPSLGKEEASCKPTNDRQDGNFVTQTPPMISYPAKKNDQVIEILDDDENQERKILPSRSDSSLANKQKLKNKQISNQFRSPSTNIKVDNHNNKINEQQKNETPNQRSATQISKPESLSQKYSHYPSKPIFDKHNQIPLPKHMQPGNKIPFSSNLPSQQYFHLPFMNSRPGPFYDNIYQQGMGINYPHSMLNYPSSLINDHAYWNGSANPYDRFGSWPHNSNTPFSYMFGQGDHNIISKNVPFMNHGISGMKGFGHANTMNGNKPFGLPEPLLKDDKLHPAVLKQFQNINKSNDKREDQKQKQPHGNVPNQQKDQLNRSISSQGNQNHAYQVNGKELQKKDSLTSVPEKKKQPEVIELLDSDDEEIKEIKNKNRSNSDKAVTMTASVDQRALPYRYQPANYPHKIQASWAMPASSNSGYGVYQKNSPYHYPSNQQKHHSHQTGKTYKEQMDTVSYLERTKQIQKQMRPDHGKSKIMTQDRTELMKERLENLQNMKKIKQCRQLQQKGLNDLLDESAAFLQATLGSSSNIPLSLQTNSIAGKSANSKFLQQTMNPQTFLQQKLIDLHNFFSLIKTDSKIMDADKIKMFEQYRHRTGVEINKWKDLPNGEYRNKIHVLNRQQKPMSTNPQQNHYSKEISGNEHVIREAQKAFQKTRSRMVSQLNKQAVSAPLFNQEGKRLLTYERMEEIKEEGKKMQTHQLTQKKGRNPGILKKDANEKDVRGKEKEKEKDKGKIECENEEKDGGWVFEWTPKLKRLRDLSKKREYDSVILTGPEFQAQLPRLITNNRQLCTIKAIKRANLLRRLYRYCAQI